MSSSELDPNELLLRAQQIAMVRQHEYVTLEHMLASLLEQPDVMDNLIKLKIDVELLAMELSAYLDTDVFPKTDRRPHRTKSVEELMHYTVGSAIITGKIRPTATDFLIQLISMPSEDSFAVTILLKMGLTPLDLKRLFSHKSEKKPFIHDGMPPETPSVNSQEEAEAFVELYATNLNKRAQDSKIDPLIGRHTEVATIVQIMARRTKNNAVLTGESGVGKTSVVEGLALKIVRGEVPEVISNATVYSLEIASMVAGTRFRGDFEERMKIFIQSMEMIPDSILFIDEIHTIMGAGSGSQGSLDVANILKPALAKGTIRCIGSTTLEEYRKHFEKDRALVRRFKKVDILEPSLEDAKLIIHGLSSYYEEFHKVKYSEEALDAAVELTHRYVTNAFLPDKAIDIIDNAGARQRVATTDQRKANIGIEEIEAEVSKITHIPEKTISEDDDAKLSHLEENLKISVIGQDLAISELTDSVFLQRAGLKEPNKPAGSYLFTGPTGTGKTETAKTLSETLGIPLLRYNMSEYMEKHTVSRLIGAPPGYTGFAEGNSGSGMLINDIDTNPYCVLLLDEIEKAHPDVLNIFLQVMDNGELTSSSGKTVPFRNVIIIMTSNAGAKELTKKSIGFGRGTDSDADEPAIASLFSPEFRNRLDAIVKFGALKPAHMLKIVDKFIIQLQEMASPRNVVLDIDTDSREWLAKKGYEPTMGARPLKRVIAENINKPLSRLMVTGSLAKGGTAKVRVVDEKIVVSV